MVYIPLKTLANKTGLAALLEVSEDGVLVKKPIPHKEGATKENAQSVVDATWASFTENSQ